MINRKFGSYWVLILCVVGLTLAAAGFGLGIAEIKSHGVPCGNVFVESSKPLEADLAHLNATNTYDEDSSAVLRCGRARYVQAFISHAFMYVGAAVAMMGLFIFMVKKFTLRSRPRYRI